MSTTETKTVMVEVGKREVKRAGKTKTKTVYSTMKLTTTEAIGVPEGLIKSGITEEVEIGRGAAAGATYKRTLKGARGIQYKFVYVGQGLTDSAGKKHDKYVNVGFPAGTPAITVAQFIQKLSKKPQKFVTPSGKTHYVATV